ncbi:MAG: tetratricopeptide repeat protein [Pirellulaceae bacterium]
MLQGEITESQLQTLKHHLDIAVEWEQAPANLSAAATQFAVQDQQYSRAMETLRQAAAKSPEFEGELFRLAIQQNRDDVAKETAERALPRLLQKITDGTATAQDRIDVADILYYQGDIKEARGALVDALAQANLSPEDTAKLKRALSELYRLRFAQTLKVTAESWEADVRLLNEAMSVDPTNPRVAEQVAMLARIGGDSPPDALMQQLQEFLAEGTATPVTHAWIAEAHILRNEFSDAISHLENVLAGMPNAAQSHNNLAYAIALSDPARMDEALAHAQAAVAAGPRVADFHDTLGHILMKLGRVAEAISEMEMAIQLQPGRPDFHERLADAYATQGNQEMVRLHRQLVEKYKSPPQPANAK